MNQLAAYLLKNIILDFQGDLTLEMARNLLGEDDSPAARALLGKLSTGDGVNDMMLVLADCLQEFIGTGITKEVVAEQMKLYAEA